MAGRPKKRRGKRCGAQTRGGTPCRSFAELGRERCRLHGGAQPRGQASAQYKHGLYALQAELGRVHREVYEAIRSGQLDERDAALECFAYAAGKLAELQASQHGRAPDLDSDDGRKAQQALLLAQSEVRQALKLRVEARVGLDAPQQESTRPITIVFGPAPDPRLPAEPAPGPPER